jgi:hypothetical protein
MTIKIRQGDASRPLVKEGTVVIAHVCNNRGGWGRGFVVSLSREYPEAERAYRSMNSRQRLLGTIQLAVVEKEDPRVVVANMIAQDGYRSPQNPRPLNLPALNQCLNSMASWLSRQPTPLLIQMPLLGGGLGGYGAEGDWDEHVLPLIEENLGQFDVRVLFL